MFGLNEITWKVFMKFVCITLLVWYLLLFILAAKKNGITGELKHTFGILHRRHDFIELYRIKDFQVDRPLIYRLFGFGNLRIYTSDKTSPVFRLMAIRKPQQIYTILRERVEQNRRDKHVFEVD